MHVLFSTQCIANFPQPLSSENGHDLSLWRLLVPGLTLEVLNGPLQDNFLLSLPLLLSHSSIKGSFIANSPTGKSVAKAFRQQQQSVKVSIETVNNINRGIKQQ